MNEDDPQALELLLSHVERQRDEALAEQLRLHAVQRAARARADELATYRREYEARWSAEFCREGRMELVRCYQGFVERLNQAVDQQEGIAVRGEDHLQAAVLSLRGLEVRAAALAKLIERRRLERARGTARREQQQGDEQAARAAWQRRAADPSRRLL